ncbi:MAG TPA: hypothetical protein VHR84_14655 [Terriglobales bacterium]|jgi:hypothetical protein|nr:hypothetical protein [Terriglobales bacterium]
MPSENPAVIRLAALKSYQALSNTNTRRFVSGILIDQLEPARSAQLVGIPNWKRTLNSPTVQAVIDEFSNGPTREKTVWDLVRELEELEYGSSTLPTDCRHLPETTAEEMAGVQKIADDMKVPQPCPKCGRADGCNGCYGGICCQKEPRNPQDDLGDTPAPPTDLREPINDPTQFEQKSPQQNQPLTKPKKQPADTGISLDELHNRMRLSGSAYWWQFEETNARKK